MDNLEKLKQLIDEENYPYFTDSFLQAQLSTGDDIKDIARRLCLIKAGIEEYPLGDVKIPSPRDHFIMLAHLYRRNRTKVVGREDERK